MSKKAGIIFVIMGAVLMLSAWLLFCYNRYEDRSAGQEAEILLEGIQSAINENQGVSGNGSDTEVTDGGTHETVLSTELPVLMIDGYEYIGYISIPSLELELPVMSEWDYNRLQMAPCRHFGSSRTDDLVIAAHNYRSHFGNLSNLEVGAEITFIDMDGITNTYALVKLETLSPDSVDAVQNSGYDLVLYTCTTSGTTRVAAFCDRIAESSNGEETDE